MRVNSKFMTSQAGLQTITLHILPSISRSKGNQAMKFGQFIECNKRNIFLQKTWRKWGRETSSSPLFVFKKALYKGKACGQHLSSDIFWYSSPWTYSKNKLYNIWDCWSRDMLNFDFLEKGLGIVSAPHFLYDFSRKMFLILYSTNWQNFIIWMPLLLKILDNISIAIVCFPGYDFTNFEINV